ncbi:MAG: fasciclin domain-containing protein, partial [Cytophagales bacterium]|nr:fasciclin domain-containing protein [Cytophagales bacterium]
MQTLFTIIKKIARNQRVLACLLGVMVVMAACRPEDESELVPDNRKGNILNELSARPEFSSFVQAVNRTGYKNSIGGGGGLFTVFAPNNEAVQAFLTANNYANLDAIPLLTLNKYLGNHFIPASMLYPADFSSRRFNAKGDNRYSSSGDKFLTVLYTDA